MITHDELQILLIGSLELHDDHPPFGLRPVSYCTTPRVLAASLQAASLVFCRWTNHKRSDCNREGSFHVYSEFGIAWNKWELVDKVGSDRQRHGCVRRDKDHGCGCAQ